MIKCGVNIDHVATIRQARGGHEPSPLDAAFCAQRGGAHGITMHLREDKRHIQDHDVLAVKEHVLLPLNLEMALSDEIISFALNLKPHCVTLVPEKREELTTEGGLDVIKFKEDIKEFVSDCHSSNIIVSLFIDPSIDQIKASGETKADFIELHTGDYANAFLTQNEQFELDRLYKAASFAHDEGLGVNAGHGLNYTNVSEILNLKGLNELNIGHSIISRAVFCGIEKAVKDMVNILS